MERIVPPGGLGPNVGAGGGNAHMLNARFLRAENDRLTIQLAEAQAEIERLKGQTKKQRHVIAKVYSRVAIVAGEICDENDRLFFGSSNDANILQELSEEWAAHKIMGEEILTSEQEAAAFKRRAQKAESELAALKAAQIAYASEFSLSSDGEPDTGSIHENIRKLTAELAALKAAMVKPLEWRTYGYHRQGLEASAFGLETAYRVDGKPGDWVLTSTGAREYIHTPGYETRAAAQAAAKVDHRRRVIAELARATLPVPPEE